MTPAKPTPAKPDVSTARPTTALPLDNALLQQFKSCSQLIAKLKKYTEKTSGTNPAVMKLAQLFIGGHRNYPPTMQQMVCRYLSGKPSEADKANFLSQARSGKITSGSSSRAIGTNGDNTVCAYTLYARLNKADGILRDELALEKGSKTTLMVAEADIESVSAWQSGKFDGDMAHMFSPSGEVTVRTALAGSRPIAQDMAANVMGFYIKHLSESEEELRRVLSSIDSSANSCSLQQLISMALDEACKATDFTPAPQAQTTLVDSVAQTIVKQRQGMLTILPRSAATKIRAQLEHDIMHEKRSCRTPTVQSQHSCTT